VKYLQILLTSLLILTSFPKAVLTRPVDQKKPSFITKKQTDVFEIDPPLCYMRTASGGILNLNSLCEPKLRNTAVIPSRSINNAYNPVRINKFDRELYGE